MLGSEAEVIAALDGLGYRALELIGDQGVRNILDRGYVHTAEDLACGSRTYRDLVESLCGWKPKLKDQVVEGLQGLLEAIRVSQESEAAADALIAEILKLDLNNDCSGKERRDTLGVSVVDTSKRITEDGSPSVKVLRHGTTEMGKHGCLPAHVALVHDALDRLKTAVEYLLKIVVGNHITEYR